MALSVWLWMLVQFGHLGHYFLNLVVYWNNLGLLLKIQIPRIYTEILIQKITVGAKTVFLINSPRWYFCSQSYGPVFGNY